jgi:hypothetical protein
MKKILTLLVRQLFFAASLTCSLAVYAQQDVALRSVTITGQQTCNQLTLEIVNVSETETVPYGAVIQIMIQENSVVHPNRYIILNAPLAPGASITRNLDNAVSATDGLIKVATTISYAQDNRSDNNSFSILILRGTLTVGGESPDFPTVRAAAELLSAPEVIRCGDLTFRIRNGRYTEEVMFGNIISPSGNIVTFESESGNPDDVILYSLIETNSELGTITIQNVNGLRVKYLTIERESTPSVTHSQIAVAIRGNINDLILEGNKMRSRGVNGGVRMDNVNLHPLGETQDNITIRNNAFEAGNSGIINGTLSDTDPADSALIDNLLIENNRFTNLVNGIIDLHGKNVTIAGNEILLSHPISFLGISAAASQLVIERNKVTINSTVSKKGIEVLKSLSSAVKITNNMISLFSTQTASAIVMGTVADAEIIHNTIRVEKNPGGIGNISFMGISFIAASALMPKKVTHNIITSEYNNMQGLVLLLGTRNEIDRNIFFIPNGSIARTGGPARTYRTLPEWQTTGYDLNSAVIQPVFVSGTDLHLAGEQFSLRLESAVEVPFDIDGEPRLTNPYPGADEYYAPSDVSTSASSLAVQTEVYPNPVEGNTLTLHGQFESGFYNVNITSLYGVPYQQKQIFMEAGGTSIEMPVNDLPGNMYILKLIDPSKRVIISRFEKK